jgi:hypothetical protein
VGGWVLRGDIESGIVASQGTSPSTFWRDDIMTPLVVTQEKTLDKWQQLIKMALRPPILAQKAFNMRII